MRYSRSQFLSLAVVLGISALAGRWAAFPPSSPSAASSGASDPEAAATGARGKMREDRPGIPGAAGQAVLSPEAVREIQGELLELVKSGALDDGGDADGNSNMLLVLRWLARAACLFNRLSPSQQEEVFGQLPESMRGEAFTLLKTFGDSLKTGSTPLTTGDFAERMTAAQNEAETYVTLSKWWATDPAGLLQYWKVEAAKPNAAEWIKSQMGNALWEIGAAHPRLMIKEAMTVADPALRKSMLKTVHLNALYSGEKSQWPADGDGLLKQLIAEKPDQREGELMGVLAKRLKHETPEEARLWVESLELGPDSRDWTEKAMISAWRSVDRKSAAEWMLAHAPPEERADKIAEFVSWWTDAGVPKDLKLTAAEPDIAACADWILSLGITPETEKGIGILADGWIQAGEPAAALAWAQAIPDPATRASCLEKVTTQIERRYPDTWRAMLDAAGLPAR